MNPRDPISHRDSMSQLIDPKWAVRRNAEFRAAQRRGRLAAMKWYGISNSRPTASATPFTGVYSNTWAGLARHPMIWPVAYPSVVLQIEPADRVYYDP
jgi:hypothetical protein